MPTVPKWRTQTEKEFWRYACRDNFWAFFLHAWGTLHGPHARDWWVDRMEVAEPLAHWYQQQVMEWLKSRQEHKKEVRHIMVVVTREFGKTTLISQAGLLWLHLLDPNVSTFIGGDKIENATDVLKGIKTVLQGADRYSQFKKLYGDWLSGDIIDRRDQVVHNMRTASRGTAPSFGVWGVETGLTGKHPDVLCLDDPNTYERVASQANWYEIVNLHCASLTPVIRADGLFILVGTPYSDADHLHKTLRRDGVATLTGLPMTDFQPRKDGIWHVFHMPGRDANDYPTVPNVWSLERMAKFERENPDRYAAQVLLRPELSEHNPLTIEQIRDCFVEEKDVPFGMLRYSLHFDTAFRDPSKQTSQDESVFQVWGHWRDGSGDVVFIEGYSSNIWRGEDFYRQVVKLIQRYQRMGRKFVGITDETSLGKVGQGKMLMETFCHGAGLVCPPFIEIHRGGKKKLEKRIIPAASMWADGYVKLIKDAPGLTRLTEQMSRIGRSQHDDWADAGADVFHPSVYRRQRNLSNEAKAPPWLATDQDVILKAVKPDHAEELRRQYDAWVKRDEIDFEPV